MVANRVITDEEWNDTAEAAEERLNDRLAEPRRVSTFYDYLVADGKKAIQEIAVEIGELKALRETFRDDPKIHRRTGVMERPACFIKQGSFLAEVQCEHKGNKELRPLAGGEGPCPEDEETY